jgi:hypothetical protein
VSDSEPLAELARVVLRTNPFRVNRVSRPDDLRVDVDVIHGPAFRRLLRRVEEAHDGAAAGVLLTGIAGCGKSHLIARLWRWALEDRSVVPVFLHNLQASPERIARYVLKATISSLLSLGDAGGVLDGLRRVCGPAPAEGTDALDAEIHCVLRALLDMVGDPDRADLLDAAVSWLSGEELDDDQAAFLYGVSGRPIRSTLPDAAAVEQVLLVLARLLAADRRVLLLCLDQIDNLDVDLVSALTAFLHALLDHADHMVVICSGVTTTMDRLREEAISEAAWDRVAQYKVELQEVTADEARMLVERRLADLLDPLPALDTRRAADPLFPLGQPWFKGRFGGLQFRPRDVITWARDAWELAQVELEDGGIDAWLAARAEGAPAAEHRAPPAAGTLEDAIRDLVRSKVEERRGERLRNPASLPPDADNLATLLRALLRLCAGRPEYGIASVEAPNPPKRGAPRSFDLLVREAETERVTGVLCLPGGHGNVTTAALRRAHAEREGLDRVLLATDARRPFKPGAKGGGYYDALAADPALRFHHLRLDLLDVVQLDALVSVLGLARVGDLEVEHPRGAVVAVTEAQTAEAMHALDLFRAHPLLGEVLAPVGPRSTP